MDEITTYFLDFGFDNERRRRNNNRARANHYNGGGGGGGVSNSIGPFLQILPFLLLILVSLISNFMSVFGIGGSGSNMYEYSFRKSHKTPVGRETFRYNVPYYVSSNHESFFRENKENSNIQSKIREMEVEIERVTLNKLQTGWYYLLYRCRNLTF